MMRRAALALTLALAGFSPATQALLAGSAEGPEPDAPRERMDRAGEDSAWSGVGALVTDDGVYTGVLIDARHVLTAGHVAAGARPGVTRFSLPRRHAAPAEVPVAAVYLAPGATGDVRRRPHRDLGIVQLASAAPDWAKRHRPAPGRVAAYTEVTLVGFGASGDGVRGYTTPADPALRRVGENVLDVLMSVRGGQVPVLFQYDYDGPGVDGPLGGATLGNRRETVVGPGDSGAPVFRTTDRALIGIATVRWNPPGVGAGHFGSGGGGVLLAPYRSWIRNVLAGQLAPRRAAPPNPPQ